MQERSGRPPDEVKACARRAGWSSACSRGATCGPRRTATTRAPPGAAPAAEALEGCDPATRFGDDGSPRDDAVDPRGDEAPTVACLAQLAGPRDALACAVGTGRIAWPLPRAGVRVDGLERSRHLGDRRREPPDGTTGEVTLGARSRVTTGCPSGRVSRVDHTIGHLRTPDDQVRGSEHAARHLSAEGVFVRERRVPTAPARPGHPCVDAEPIGVDYVGRDVCRDDPVTQRLDEPPIRLRAAGLACSPIRRRLAHPPAFDRMARLAGLRRRERWGGNSDPSTATSWRPVSVDARALA